MASLRLISDGYELEIRHLLGQSFVLALDIRRNAHLTMFWDGYWTWLDEAGGMRLARETPSLQERIGYYQW